MARRQRLTEQPELPLQLKPAAAANTNDLRDKALAALAKKREKARLKALRLELELEAEWRRTQRRLAEEAELRARLERDPRLDALLEFRRAGKPVPDAVEEVERRFQARAAEGRESPSHGAARGPSPPRTSRGTSSR